MASIFSLSRQPDTTAGTAARIAALVALSSIFLPPSLFADGSTWAAFRGSNADGIALERGLFERFPELALEVVWRRPIGGGYSAVAVAEGRAVTLHVDGRNDVVAAFDAETGKPLWKHVLEPTYVGHDGSHDGPISTPLLADGRVVALGAHGRLVSLDAATGEVGWTKHLVEDLGVTKPHYGFGTSPLLVAGHLVLALGGEPGTVAALDPATGEIRWAAGDDRVNYQTPTPWSFEGEPQLVAVGNAKLYGVAPGTGEVLWSVEHGGNGARGIDSMTPVPVGPGRLFLAHQNDASKLVEVRRGEDGGFAVEDVWEGRAIRNSYNVPLPHGGSLYAYSSRFLTSVDAATGEIRWRSRQPGDGFVILVDGHLVLLTKTGSLHVAEASPEGYRELAGLQVFADHAWSTPAYTDGRLYLRSFGEIARVDVRSGAMEREKTRLVADAASPFGLFLTAVSAAPGEQKKALVDRFLESQQSFPIIEGPQAHFIYRGPADDVALAGDMYGNRREEPMERVPGTDLFVRTVELERDARVAYLFLVDYEPTPDPRNSRRTDDVVFAADLEMAFGSPPLEMSWMTMPEWRQPAYLARAPGERRGTLEKHELTHEALGEEGKIALQVYLPRGYTESASDRFKTLYIHGGSEAITGGTMPNSLDNLFGTSVEPALAVFVDIPDFGPSYSVAFLEAVVPFIDRTYRTAARASSRLNLAAGFLGATALSLTLGTDLFGGAGIQSAVLFRDLFAQIDGALAAHEGAPPRLYFDWGTYGLRNPHEGWNMVDANRELVGKLEAKGFAWTGGEAHDGGGWSSWKNRTGAMLEALLPIGGEPAVQATGTLDGE